MTDHIHTSSRGIGFVGCLTILFIALKLLDKIDWSWWWVLAPLWISACISLFIIIVILIIVFIIEVFK